MRIELTEEPMTTLSDADFDPPAQVRVRTPQRGVVAERRAMVLGPFPALTYLV